MSDDTEFTFPSGTPFKPKYGTTLISTIDKLHLENALPSGLAVQQQGRCLFVAHEGINELHVLDKTTGATLQSLSIRRPRGLAVDPAGNLWMISEANTVARYTVKSDGTLSPATLSLANLVDPLGLGVYPDGTRVLVGDGGRSQQIKAFLTTTGAADWTYGIAGGYAVDSTVSNDRFAFTSEKGNQLVFFAFQADGSFWVNDGGNSRVQHFGIQGDRPPVFIDRIMSLGATYAPWVDRNNITRLFAEFREFTIDYAAPLSGTSGWTLSRNWRAGIDKEKYWNNNFTYPTTLSNGRTYALMGLRGNSYNSEVVELPAKGTMRFTGVIVPILSVLCGDGSIERYDQRTRTLSRYALTGFDAGGNPRWSTTGELLASIPPAGPNEPFGIPRNQSLSSTGKVVFFNPGIEFSYTPPKVYATGYHLGVIPKGGNAWLWKTELATSRSYAGPYPPAGTFDIGNSVNNYAGGNVNILDHHVITSYHGEFWKSGQTNKYNHYWDDGLAIGQFGTTRADSPGVSAAEMGGNAQTPLLVRDTNGDLYLWHGEESDHAGIHRWKINGAETIAEQAIPLAYPKDYKPPVLDYVDLMKGLPFAQPLADNTAGWTRSPPVNQVTNPYTDIWNVETSRLKYDRLSSPDLYVRFAKPAAATHSVSRDLGSNNVATRWRLTGEIAYPGNAPNGNAIFQYLEVLDDAGRVLTSIQPVVDRKAKPFANTTVANGAVAATDANGGPFEISVTATGATFTIGQHAPVTAPLADPAGNWRTPKTLRVRFENIGNGTGVYAAIIDLKDLRFYSK